MSDGSLTEGESALWGVKIDSEAQMLIDPFVTRTGMPPQNTKSRMHTVHHALCACPSSQEGGGLSAAMKPLAQGLSPRMTVQCTVKEMAHSCAFCCSAPTSDRLR
mmetsp:Transcript_43115/g.71683  ORF Transcript_43115/g.71683 Transcript_43115/m.71683 type:complete len:105 (+) Transcript_43115:289-603(+)